MTDPTDRHLFGDADRPPPPDLSAALAGWDALRARVGHDLDAALPDREALVLAGLAGTRPRALDVGERARASRVAAVDRPAVAAALTRVARDADAFDAAWAGAGLEPRATPSAAPRAADRPAARSGSRVGRWAVRGVVLAAVAAFAAVATFTLVRDRGFDALAAADAVRTVALADGSAVTLAPGTSLLVRVADAGPREARLRGGQALFDVAHDPARPFTVETDNARARVLGTTFTVRTDGVQTDVVLVSGAVELAPRGRAAVRLAPGESSRVVALDAPSAPARADVGAALAWTGHVVARETAAREVAARLAARFGRPLGLSPALAGEPVSGTFGADGFEDAARMLARALGGRVEASGAGLRIAAE